MKHVFLILILAIVVSGCGARKVAKTQTEEAQKVQITDNTLIQKKEEIAVKVVETTSVNDRNKTKIQETIYKPIDPTKEAMVTTPDGKSHKLHNAEVMFKETEQQNNTKTDNSRNSEQFQKSELSELSEFGIKAEIKKSNLGVNNEREAWSVWNWIWLLIPIVLLVIVIKNRLKIVNWVEGLWWV